MIDVTCFNWVKMIQKSKLGPYEKKAMLRGGEGDNLLNELYRSA